MEDYEIFLINNGVNPDELSRILFWPPNYFDKYQNIKMFSKDKIDPNTPYGLIVVDYFSNEEDFIAKLNEIQQNSKNLKFYYIDMDLLNSSQVGKNNFNLELNRIPGNFFYNYKLSIF
jgi:hypothetical protein